MKVTHIGLSKITDTLHLYLEDGRVIPHFYEYEKAVVAGKIRTAETRPDSFVSNPIDSQKYRYNAGAEDYTKATVEEFFKEEK